MSIIVTDLDGTLLNDDKEISILDRQTIIKMHKNNTIIIASGRANSDIKEMLIKNQIHNYILPFIICRNGQEIYDIMSKRMIYENYLTFDIIKGIVSILEANNVYWYGIDKYTAYFKEIKYNCLKYKKSGKYFMKEIKDIDELKNIMIEKFMINEVSESKIEKIKMIIKEEYDVDFMKFNLEKRYKDTYFKQNMITMKNVNKYNALIILKNKLNLSGNVISLGNGVNDYELLKNSSYGICVRNGDVNIKNVANFITKSNNDNSFTYAMEYILKKGQSKKM